MDKDPLWLVRDYYENIIANHPKLSDSFKRAYHDMLYDPKYMLTRKEWNQIYKTYKEEFGIDQNISKRCEMLIKYIPRINRFNQRRTYYNLHFKCEFDYYVYDKTLKEIYPCYFDEHLKTILFILNTRYKREVEKMTDYELQSFVLTNFSLQGQTKSLQQYTKEVVKER